MGLQGELRDFNAVTSAFEGGASKKAKKKNLGTSATPAEPVVASENPMQPVARTDFHDKGYAFSKGGMVKGKRNC